VCVVLVLFWLLLFVGVEGVSFSGNCDCCSICRWDCACGVYVGFESLQEAEDQWCYGILVSPVLNLCVYFIVFCVAKVEYLWQLGAILPLAVVHTLGNLFTNMSLGKVAVSFTHTIKAMEPFFSVVLSAMFLGEVRYVVQTILLNGINRK